MNRDSHTGVAPLEPDALVSVVIPAYNEAAVLEEFHRRLAATIDRIPQDFEVIYVNDGSTDSTIDIMHALRGADPRVALVNLSLFLIGRRPDAPVGLQRARWTGQACVIWSQTCCRR